MYTTSTVKEGNCICDKCFLVVIACLWCAYGLMYGLVYGGVGKGICHINTPPWQ